MLISLFLFFSPSNMDFFKLHSQMNPPLRARTDSNIMPRTKNPSQKWRTKDGPCEDWNIKNVAFSVKTACTLFIVCEEGLSGWEVGGWSSCLATHGTAGLSYCLVPLQMSTVREVWICGRLADSPLSSQQPTSLSATLAVSKKHNVQPAVPLLTPWGGLWIFLFVLPALICLSLSFHL